MVEWWFQENETIIFKFWQHAEVIDHQKLFSINNLDLPFDVSEEKIKRLIVFS